MSTEITDVVAVRLATAEDGEAIARIYNHYVTDTTITFEEATVSAEDMARRIIQTSEAGFPWLVAESDGAIIGYAYADKWKGRCSYRYSVETTVYLSPDHGGMGIGSKLYGILLSQVEAAGMHAVVAGISLPNPASVALHEKFGFENVAHFREVGHKFGRWLDVGYWQLTLPTS